MRNFGVLTLVLLVLSCSEPKEQKSAIPEGEFPDLEVIENNNPAAPGFNSEGSDAVAVILADKVMNAMGGRDAWDSTRFITWNFFRARKHFWDKESGDIRIENQKDDRVVLMNINDMTGKVFMDGAEMTQSDSVEKYLEWGKRVWINDSYWLAMPFKLKDSGVTLVYLGDSQTLDGESSQKIRMTFNDVGVTPENAFEVWVSNETELVNQWAYFKNASDSSASWTRPWSNYFTTGSIKLSDNRGDYSLTDVAVLAEVPEGLFSEFSASL